MRKRTILSPIIIVLVLLGFYLFNNKGGSNTYQHDSGFIFGTSYNVIYQCDDNLKTDIEQELHKVDMSLSPFNEQSVITAVNNNVDITVDEMFTEVFNLAHAISEDTHGAFDITVAPLVNAWGFGFKTGAMPDKEKLDSLRALVGYKSVSLNNGKITKERPETMLDCSAIAKGYGVDRIARLLRSLNIENFMVEIGGEIVAQGHNKNGKDWRIGVTKPTDDSLSVNQELQTVIAITDIAMATSGNYRNFYYKDGKKYAHTIDPQTGKPVQHSLLSATVFSDNCALADAYATSFMVLGMDKAKEVLKRHKELMAYFIYSDKDGKNAVWFSPELESKISK